MAFVSRIGNLLKNGGSKHANMGLSASNSSFYQAIRSMSSAKLFVGGLSYGTDEMSLRESFAQYGEVTEARVITDRDSGRSRGFGFVSFTSTEAANSALQAMDGQDLHGRRIRVNFATEKPRPAYGDGGYGNYPGGGGGGYGNYGGGSGGNFGGGDGGGNYAGGNSNVGGYGDANSGNYNATGGDNYFGGGSGADSGFKSAGGYGGGGGGTDVGNEGFGQDLPENKYGDDNDEPDNFANTRG